MYKFPARLSRQLNGVFGQTIERCATWRQSDDACGVVDSKASNPTNPVGKFELRVAFGQCLLCLLAFCDVDDDADHALQSALAIIGNEPTGIDPSDLPVAANNSIIEPVVGATTVNHLPAQFLVLRKIVWMYGCLPLIVCYLGSSFGQAIDHRIAFGHCD